MPESHFTFKIKRIIPSKNFLHFNMPAKLPNKPIGFTLGAPNADVNLSCFLDYTVSKGLQITMDQCNICNSSRLGTRVAYA